MPLSFIYWGWKFIQDKQAKINKMAAEYERTHPEVGKMQVSKGENL